MARGLQPKDVYEGISSLARIAHGYGAFVLATVEKTYRSSNKGSERFDYVFYPRFSQPCYGEMRRYKQTHGDLCTQPSNERPGDLHWPFPHRGLPFALAVPFAHTIPVNDDSDFFFRSMKETGWGRVIPIDFYEKDGHIHGLLFKDLDVDPTVLVSLIQFVSSYRSYSSIFKKLIDGGLTVNEACISLMMNGPMMMRISQGGNTYYFPSIMSCKRFVEGVPNDLSGGTYSKGYDYNRTDLNLVWQGGKSGLDWYKSMTEIVGVVQFPEEIPFEQYISAVKQVVKDALLRETEFEIIPASKKYIKEKKAA